MNRRSLAGRVLPRPFGAGGKAIAVAIGLAAALLLGEAAARVAGLDWRLLRPALYWQKVDLSSHQADPDPRLMYRLRPGRQQQRCGDQPYAVSVNSLGARGPERAAAKPAGVFRIACFGGSHLYGACVNDDQTWPAQLERLLNQRTPGRFEVWNHGTSAYVATQMAALADEVVARLTPDLTLFEITNTGTRALLWDSDPRPYFARDSSLWRGLAPPDALTQPWFISYESRLALLRRSALARCLAAPAARTERAHEAGAAVHEEWNVAAFRQFCRRWSGRTRLGLLLQDVEPEHPEDFRPYFSGLDLPVMQHWADGLPDEYARIHPPPRVLAYQAARIAEWLRGRGLIPPD